MEVMNEQQQQNAIQAPIDIDNLGDDHRPEMANLARLANELEEAAIRYRNNNGK